MIRESEYRGTDPDRGKDQSLAWRLRQPVVPMIKGAARAVGMATADLRCRPDYLIVGGKRTGSTTLARNLAAEPDVLGLFPAREDRKGIYGFDVHYDRGLRWYRSHFPLERTKRQAERSVGRNVVVGEASPWYLQHPHAPVRAHEFVPQARVVAVVRDPVERAYSHWRERVRQGVESLTTFEDALDAEPERLAGEWDRMIEDPSYVSLAHLNFGYVAQSRYHDALSRWADAFGPEQLLVLRSEDLFADPEATLARVRTFLGLEQHQLKSSQHFNRLPGTALDPATRSRLVSAVSDDQLQLLARFFHEE